VPVWHAGTKQWVKEGKLALLGITQEQHSDRSRLLAQWQGFGWPILHDPINIMGAPAVPIFVAIDEHGIVRDTKPRLETFATHFLDKTFVNDAKEHGARCLTPVLSPGQAKPDFRELRERAEKDRAFSAWCNLGDGLALWGGEKHLNAAIDAYRRAVQIEPRSGPALFRIGVCLRSRYESEQRQAGDFQAAIDHWSQALEIDPNQYIWRRRIQQYGPRLDKPYSFYDWVSEADKQIAARGEKPVVLKVRPGGAEIAYPLKSFPAVLTMQRSPGPSDKLKRDGQGLIQAEVTVVPSRIRPGQTASIHVVLRPDPKLKAHWNNEADPLRLWIDSPERWQVAERLLESPRGRKAVSEEERILNFEVKVPAGAKGTIRMGAFALYHVCDDAGGACRFLRLDIPIDLHVSEEKR
jgi:tetratricopeptide (TPR) repeat protein